MFELTLKGIDSIGVGDTLRLPFSFSEILRTPLGYRISIENYQKHGGEIGKWLLSQTPITNTRKYISVYLNLHYLSGINSHVPTTDWHCDGSNSPFMADDIFHTMVCMGEGLSGDLKTEFLAEDKTVYIPDEIDVQKLNHQAFRRWVTNNQQVYDLKPVQAESGRMHTWTSLHLHRVKLAPVPHFRLFWKVVESNQLVPNSGNDMGFTKVMRTQSGETEREMEALSMNIEQGENGIIIRGMKIKE